MTFENTCLFRLCSQAFFFKRNPLNYSTSIKYIPQHYEIGIYYLGVPE